MKPYSGLQKFSRLLPIILMLWIFLFWRVHLIDVNMPYFIDELNHINRARIVWTFTDLHVSTTPGKFLLYYYLGLFDIPPNLPGWIARTATTLLTLIGAAGTYALARTLFSRNTGLLALVLLSVFPFMIFHERLTLSDPLTASLAVIMVWWSIHFARRPSMHRANILGAMICIMLLGKILAGPLVVMPLVAIIFMNGTQLTWREPLIPQLRAVWTGYRPYLMRVFWINVVVWGILLSFYVGRGLLDPDNTNPIVDDYIYTPEDRTSQLEGNVEHIWTVFRYLWGGGLSALTLFAIPFLLWKRRNTAIYLLGGIGVLWIPLFVMAARPNSRYLTIVGHLWIVLVAGAVYVAWQLIKEIPESSKRLALSGPLMLLLVGAFGFGANFSQTLITDPAEVGLPEAELNGYYRNFTGFALRDSLHYVGNQPPISDNTDEVVLVALARACDFLPYHIEDPVTLNLHIECLGRYTKYADISRIFAEYGEVYAIWEQVDPPTRIADPRWIQGRMVWLKTYERPHNGIAVEVYRIIPQDEAPIGGEQYPPE